MRRATVKNPGAQYGAVLDRFQRAQRDLVRTFRRWDSLRQALNRAERRLDLAMRIEDEAHAVRS